jgi:hypothetical protein
VAKHHPPPAKLLAAKLLAAKLLAAKLRSCEAAKLRSCEAAKVGGLVWSRSSYTTRAPFATRGRTPPTSLLCSQVEDGVAGCLHLRSVDQTSGTMEVSTTSPSAPLGSSPLGESEGSGVVRRSLRHLR